MSVKVWSRFSAKKPDGSVVKLRIEDLPLERIDDAMEFNRAYYTTGEPLQRAANVQKNPKALEEYFESFKALCLMEPALIHVCRVDGDGAEAGEVLGVGIVALETASDGDPMAKMKEFLDMITTSEIKKVFEMLLDMCNLKTEACKDKKKYPKFYEGRGIAVRPDLRGMGIGSEFIRIRRLMCEEHQIPATQAWMTSIGTQKAASRQGWQTVFEISTEQLGRLQNVTFDDKTPPTFKLMVLEVPLS